MLEGKQLILATRQFAKEDRKKSWIYTITSISLLVLAFIGAVSSFHIVIRVLSSLCITLLLVRCFALYHDYLHNAILKNSWIARMLLTLVGCHTLNPPSIWKRSHDYHHKHNSKLFTSSIGSFPIVTTQQFKDFSRFERLEYLFIRHPLTILFGYFFAFWWGMCMLSFIRNPSKHWDSIIAIAVHCSIGLCCWYFGGWTGFWLGFLIPSFFSSMIGSYLFYCQHNFPEAKFMKKEDWNYTGSALFSTSYMKMNPIMRWCAGNLGYHHVHHLNALIPFYRLKETHKAFSEEFKNVSTTSFKPRDVIRCLQMKVWDPDLNRMLKLSEIYASKEA